MAASRSSSSPSGGDSNVRHATPSCDRDRCLQWYRARLAKLAARNGYDLVIAADEPEIQASAHTLEAMGASVVAVEADLATLEASTSCTTQHPVERSNF